jgi:hypothetical protein
LKVVKNENAERVIEAIIPKKILELKPIIAGGFVVSLYYNIIRYSSSKFDRDMSRKLDDILAFNDYTNSWEVKNKVSKLLDFGDIDFWFSQNNPIWLDYNAKQNFLIRDYYPDQYVDLPPIGEHGWNNEYREPDKNKRSFRVASNNLEIRELFKLYTLQDKLVNSTYWANSFRLKKSEYDVQFIKKPFTGAKELFQNFDIINCCAAYYDGNFCFHNDLEELYDYGIIKTELDFDEISILRKIWISTRAFKYKERYNLEPDEKFCEGIFKTFVEALELQEKIDNKEYKENVIELDRYGTEDPYGRTAAPIKKVNFMLRSLFSKFEDFTKFKNYQDVFTVYFVATENDIIKRVVKKVMYPNQKESDKDSSKDRVKILF